MGGRQYNQVPGLLHEFAPQIVQWSLPLPEQTFFFRMAARGRRIQLQFFGGSSARSTVRKDGDYAANHNSETINAHIPPLHSHPIAQLLPELHHQGKGARKQQQKDPHLQGPGTPDQGESNPPKCQQMTPGMQPSLGMQLLLIVMRKEGDKGHSRDPQGGSQRQPSSTSSGR